MRRDLVVELKTVDLVRETAWIALTEQMGWEGTLSGLRRYDLWRFEGEVAGGDADAFEAGLASELERSSAYYNPNKENRRFLAEGRLDDGHVLVVNEAVDAPGEDVQGEAWRALLWVTDEGGDRAAQRRRSAARLAEGGVELSDLRSGTLWELMLRAPDIDTARGYVAGLALSRGRHEGLLLNPHYQEGRLLEILTETEASSREGGGQ